MGKPFMVLPRLAPGSEHRGSLREPRSSSPRVLDFSGTSLETRRDRLESGSWGSERWGSLEPWRPRGVLMSAAFDRQSDHI